MKIHHKGENSSQSWKFITKIEICYQDENSSFGCKLITDIEICPLDDKNYQWIDIYLSDENSWLE